MMEWDRDNKDLWSNHKDKLRLLDFNLDQMKNSSEEFFFQMKIDNLMRWSG